MPFGLRNSAASFQRFVDQVLRGLPYCYVYIDDILIASPDLKTHLEHVRTILHRLHDHGLVINPSKCTFAALSVEFLGHIVSSSGIQPNPARVTAILEFPQPTSFRKLSKFLGMVNYYRRFIPQAAQLVQPLHALSAGKNKFTSAFSWPDSADIAFTAIKQALADVALLTHPVPDANLRLQCDASDTCIGGVLEQYVDTWQPLAFYSHK